MAKNNTVSAIEDNLFATISILDFMDDLPKSKLRGVRLLLAKALLAAENARAIRLIVAQEMSKHYLNSIEGELYDAESYISRAMKKLEMIREGVQTETLSMAWIESAKQYPLQDILMSHGYDIRRNTCRCPFHDEKTGSFHIFPDNRYKCFGCGVSGDSINLYRHFTGYNFPQAVIALKGY